MEIEIAVSLAYLLGIAYTLVLLGLFRFLQKIEDTKIVFVLSFAAAALIIFTALSLLRAITVSAMGGA